MVRKNPSEKTRRFTRRGNRTLYPTRAERTTSAQIIAEFEAAEKNAAEGETPEVKATLAGRIRASRPMGKLTFAHIEDGDGKIQLFMRVNELGQNNVDFFNDMFDLGDFIQARA